MDYFSILNFTREPFSNTPDPDFFFSSRQHVACLHELELAIRLRRGLNVVLGEVGTGKTTLCRQLIRNLGRDAELECRLILDPDFSTPAEFLATVAALFEIAGSATGRTDWQLKEAIKNHLLERGTAQGKTVLLIIDEGQKTPDFCLELLREFLNYETNNAKLLQIVIFAQREFKERLETLPNFADRINLLLRFDPLNFAETRAMVRYRLELASADGRGERLFSLAALWVVYRATRGYPRKIVNLCHQIILAAIIQNKGKVDRRLARFCVKLHLPKKSRYRRPAPSHARRQPPAKSLHWRLAWAGGLAVMLAAIFGAWMFPAKLPEFLNGFAEMSLQKGLVASRTTATPDQNDIPLAGAAAGEEAAAENSQPLASSPTIAIPGPPLAAMVPDAAPGQFEMAKASFPPAVATPAPENPDTTAGIPEFLGTIRAARNDNLGSMILAVYGSEGFTNENLRLVLEANPRIANPNLIELGRPIRFPSLPVRSPFATREACRLALADHDTLEGAYRSLRTFREAAIPPLTIVPYANDARQPRFRVIFENPFADADAARKFRDRLPEAIAAQAEVVPAPAGRME